MSKKNKDTPTIAANIILKGILTGGFVSCIGIYFINSLIKWLNNYVGLSSEFSSNLSSVAFWGLVILAFVSIIGFPIVFINSYNKEVDRYNREVEKKYRGIQIVNIDSMTGVEFEQYLKRIFTNKGYRVSVTNASGDLGVDLIALGNEEKIAIQAKRYSTKVSRRAISDAVAGMYHYDCNKAMVVTNNYFSPGAIALAGSTGCILIDRDTLANWVNEFQVTDSLITQPSKVAQ